MFYDLLSNMKGLEPIKPSGAMYMMVKIDVESFPDFPSDIEFTERLMTEESVFCLPASVSLLLIHVIIIQYTYTQLFIHYSPSNSNRLI